MESRRRTFSLVRGRRQLRIEQRVFPSDLLVPGKADCALLQHMNRGRVLAFDRCDQAHQPQIIERVVDNRLSSLGGIAVASAITA